MRRLSVALAALALLAPAMTARAQVPPGTLKSAELWFDAKASLGPFRGITRVAKGMLAGGATLATTRGFVEMQATSLSTDNGLRDRDMRKTLEVEQFPVIRFDLDSVTVHADSADGARIDLVGRMTIHGVTRPIRIPANLKRQPHEIRVTGSSELIVTSYGVTKLKRMLGTLSMDPTIRVGIDVTFTIPPGNPEEHKQ